MVNTDIIFKCRKCGHHVYVDATMDGVRKVLDLDCPSCGEEQYNNWIIVGEGNYDEL